MIHPDFIQIPKPVLQNENLQPGDKFLFGYIYWFTKLKLEKCTASNEVLAEMASLTAKSVNNCLRRLEDEGFIQRLYADGSTQKTRTIHCLVEYRPSNDGSRPSNDVSTTEKETGVGIRIYNNKKINKNDSFLVELIAIVNPREKATADRLRQLNGRLKDYTVEDIRGAARSFSKSQWHKENGQMTIDNLLAPSKIGRWYQQAQDDHEPTGPTEAEKAHSAKVQENLKRFREGGK